MRVFVTGGTGLIGSRLVEHLLERGDAPVVLSRDRSRAAVKLGPRVDLVEGDPTADGDWTRGVEGADAVVHLAGENIFARRWNAEFKALIHDSRVQSTRRVVAAIARAAAKPSVLVSGSAIGFYGPCGDEELTEAAPAGSDFLAQSCTEWEAAAREVESAGVRLVIVRTGVVLSTRAGALSQMLTPFKLGVGGPVGNGRQWMSWVHLDDLVGVILHAIDHAHVRGVLNGTAPGAVTNREFSKALGRALGRPAIFPVPVFMLRLRFGEVADVISTGQHVVPARTLEADYQFRYPDIDGALGDLLNR
jgi:hypothetical protein